MPAFGEGGQGVFFPRAWGQATRFGVARRGGRHAHRLSATEVTLAAERTYLLLTALGAFLVPVGAVSLLVALRGEEPEWSRRLKAWVRGRRIHLVTAVGIGLMAGSGLLPWFMGFRPPDLGAPFRTLVGLGIHGIVPLTPLAAPLAAVLLVLRSHRLLRSLCVGLLVLNLPVWFLGCCFKGASGLDTGSGVALAGLLLTFLAAGRLRGEVPRIPAPWRLQVAVSVTAVAVGLLLLLPLRSIPLLALGMGVLAGSLFYLAATVRDVLSER